MQPTTERQRHLTPPYEDLLCLRLQAWLSEKHFEGLPSFLRSRVWFILSLQNVFPFIKLLSTGKTLSYIGHSGWGRPNGWYSCPELLRVWVWGRLFFRGLFDVFWCRSPGVEWEENATTYCEQENILQEIVVVYWNVMYRFRFLGEVQMENFSKDSRIEWATF